MHIGQFIETDYTAEPYVEELERKGLQSDTILLSGEKPCNMCNSISMYTLLYSLQRICLFNLYLMLFFCLLSFNKSFLGVQTGTANVMAQLRTTKETLSAKIPIIVRDKVFLIPNGAVWIPVVGVIQFRVEKWRKGRPTGISITY